MKTQSIQSRLAIGYFNLTDRKSKHSKKWFLQKNKTADPYTTISDQAIEHDSFMNRPLWRISPAKKKAEHNILFVHGGVFARNFDRKHWRFVQQMVENVHAEVIAPDYPLLPTFTYAETQQYFLDLLRYLSGQLNIEELYIVADTSGATIALNTVQELRKYGLPQPKELLLLSPWLDLTLSNPNIDALIDADPVHDIDVLKELASDYTDSLPANDPSVCPIYADTRRIAPITVFIGSRDIFLADCRKLKLLSESKPVVFNYREFDGMINNWMYYNFPESIAAREQLFFHIKSEPSDFEKAMQENVFSW